MGQESDAMMDYLDNNERFANLFNGGCFDGQKVVKPEELEEGSEVYKEVRGKKTVPRTRDLKKRLKSGGRLKILAIENQGDIDYTMPWRHRVMVGMKSQVVNQKEEGKGVNMCEALRGMLEDSWVEGRDDGREVGDAVRLFGQVQRMYRKGIALVVIADEVEESPEVIEPILELVRQYPEESSEDIYQRRQALRLLGN